MEGGSYFIFLLKSHKYCKGILRWFGGVWTISSTSHLHFEVVYFSEASWWIWTQIWRADCPSMVAELAQASYAPSNKLHYRVMDAPLVCPLHKVLYRFFSGLTQPCHCWYLWPTGQLWPSHFPLWSCRLHSELSGPFLHSLTVSFGNLPWL